MLPELERLLDSLPMDQAPHSTTDVPRRKAGLATKLCLATLVPLVLLAALEGVASLVVAVRDAPRPLMEFRQEKIHTEHDPELGWMNRPNLHVADLYGEGRGFTTNTQRFRAGVDYPERKPADRYRVICLGDSFTMGFGVADDDTFPARMQKFAPELEVINMGLAGFGVDQDYLWYLRDGERLAPDLLLFCVIEDDFRRMATDKFSGRYPKPRLDVVDGRLEVLNVPVADEGSSSAYWIRLGAAVDRLGLTRLLRGGRSRSADGIATWKKAARAVFQNLERRCREQGREFAIVFLPTHDQLTGAKAHATSWVEKVPVPPGVRTIDLTPEFRALDEETLLRSFRLAQGDAHYTRRGNAFVARTLLRELRQRFPAFPRHSR